MCESVNGKTETGAADARKKFYDRPQRLAIQQRAAASNKTAQNSAARFFSRARRANVTRRKPLAAASLPLDGTGRLRGHVVDHPVHPLTSLMMRAATWPTACRNEDLIGKPRDVELFAVDLAPAANRQAGTGKRAAAENLG
jgi:hypothetical protein